MGNCSSSPAARKKRLFVYKGRGTIPRGVTHVEFAPGVINLHRSAFDDCRISLRVVVLNEGIQTIGNGAFGGCSLLDSITFPSTVISIGDGAFVNCRSLREVVLNEGIQTIGDGAFWNCSSLEKITFPSTYTGGGTVPRGVTHVEFAPGVIKVDRVAFRDCRESLREVVLNEGIQTIGGEAFDRCLSLESIRFPSTVISIGQFALQGCTSLREVVLNEGIQTIEHHAFHGCSFLESITFPSTVISIGQFAFQGCTSLREVVLNEGIQTIGSCAFYSCSLLESMKFPSTVISIDGWAFQGCSSLRVVVLNEGIQTIGDNAFLGCSSLESITFPSTVINIGYKAFWGCVSLTEVVLNEAIQTIAQNAFDGCSSLETFQFADISKRYTAIRNIITVERQEEIENKINAISGMTDAEGNISISLVQIKNWGTSRALLLKILEMISNHEWEATIIAELSLWTVNIEQMGGIDDNVNHEVRRVEFPGPAMDAVLEFLFTKY